VLTNKQTNKQTDKLKTSTSLRSATPVGNKSCRKHPGAFIVRTAADAFVTGDGYGL